MYLYLISFLSFYYIVMETRQFKLAINKLFKLLNKQNCLALQKFRCCRTCAWWAFDDPYKNWYFVFTTEQNYNSYKNWEQYIYWEYPPNIYELIKECWLFYSQRDSESAICLLPTNKNEEWNI